MKNITKCLLAILFLLIPSVVFANDLEITCNPGDEPPEIVRNVDPLFQLTGFVPGSSASRTIYVQNTDTENDCKISFIASGNSNRLTDKIQVEVSQGLFSGSLTQYISNTNIPMANLSPNTEVTRTISISLPTDAGNTYASKQASFDIIVESEWGEETDGEVRGVTDETTTDRQPVRTFFSNLLGTGGPDQEIEKEVDEEDIDNDEEEEEKEEEDKIVLGEEDNGICERTLWWIPIVIQLILTLLIGTWDRSLLKKKHIKLGISLMLALAAYFATERIGCGCNLVWLCENHWIINILIALFPTITYAKRKNSEYLISEFNSTDHEP